MKTLTIGGNNHIIEFGFNCFCDTDLLERVNDMAKLFQESGVENTQDVNGIGKFKELFLLVRELLYVGFECNNPVEDIKAVGVLLDAYRKETPEGESRGLFELFTILSNELFEEGFLADLMEKLGNQVEEVVETKVTKIPTKKK